jgi:hypothetical protein
MSEGMGYVKYGVFSCAQSLCIGCLSLVNAAPVTKADYSYVGYWLVFCTVHLP